MRKLDINELNRYLQKIQMRLDEIGIGQDKDLLGKRILNLGNAVEDQDAIPLGQLDSLVDDMLGEYYKHFMFFGG